MSVIYSSVRVWLMSTIQEVKARLQEIHKSSQAACRSMEQQTRELYTLLQKRFKTIVHVQCMYDCVTTW